MRGEIGVRKNLVEDSVRQLMRVERCLRVPHKHFKVGVVENEVMTPVVHRQKIYCPHQCGKLQHQSISGCSLCSLSWWAVTIAAQNSTCTLYVAQVRKPMRADVHTEGAFKRHDTCDPLGSHPSESVLQLGFTAKANFEPMRRQRLALQCTAALCGASMHAGAC